MNQENQTQLAITCDPKKVQLLKDMFCKDATNDEIQAFLHVCDRTGLDPFVRQIYLVKRWDPNLGRNTMTIQTGIDGYRLIAERTGAYSPGKEPTFTYDKDGKIVSAVAYVKKRTNDGTWHEISASAYFDEYAQRKKDGSFTGMWSRMPHSQLAKCAESLALRRGFPAELSGVYTKEEMQQAEVEVIEPGLRLPEGIDRSRVNQYIESKATIQRTAAQIREKASQNPAMFLEAFKQWDMEEKKKLQDQLTVDVSELEKTGA